MWCSTLDSNNIDERIRRELIGIVSTSEVKISDTDTWRTILNKMTREFRENAKKETMRKITRDIDETITLVSSHVRNDDFRKAQNELQGLITRLKS